ncbi:aspartic protease [Histoplasma capsulatum H143]|uniref:Probable aspartic-type endopeptidase OPSB n=1 Tax=Ajellomyces capsulatus (strain H143) TaxID=544712 RepID=C6HGT3_AJECH|nr:aspartic protease [Histoplasma capsulatum H143]
MAVYTLCRIQISGDPIPRSDPSQAQGTNRIDPCAVADAVSVFCCCISAAAAARRNLCRSGKITEYRCIRCRQETGRWLTNGALVIAAAADTYIRRHILRTAVETLVDTSIYTSQHVEYAARVPACLSCLTPTPSAFLYIRLRPPTVNSTSSSAILVESPHFLHRAVILSLSSPFAVPRRASASLLPDCSSHCQIRRPKLQQTPCAMRGVTALCTLGTALLCSLSTLSTPVRAIQLLARDARNVVGFDFQRRQVANPVERDRLRKRKGNVVEQLLNNEVTLYFCNITLGTPEQPLRMHLDTGSSDLWSNAPDSTLCTQNGDPCSAGGTYDRTASSTYGFVNSLFNISYVDGSSASGDYVTDTMRIGGVSLNDFQFGVGHTSSSSEGVLGIGYPTNEALMAKSGQKPYANLPFALVKQGLINWPAYSIWLNDLDASTGSILFGGVNTEKFHGKLQTLPIQQREGGIYVDLVVPLTGLTLTTRGVTQRLAAGAVPVLL